MTAQTSAPTRRKADNIALGIGITLFAIVIFGIQDALTKLLVQTYPPFQLAMIRFWAFAAFSLILVSRQAPLRQALRSRQPVAQVLRGILLVVDIWFFAAALKTVPLAEIQAIILVYPLIATIASIPILGEKVGPFRFGAVAVGFLGALIIVRPGGLPIDIGVGYAIAAATCYALYLALTRRVSSTDTTATSMVYVGVIGLVLTSSVGFFFWVPIDPASIPLLIGVMVTSVAAHGLMMFALSLAPASTLQPFNYMALPWGVFFSWAVFGHLIDPVALLGGVVIVGAGLVVMARERRLSRLGRRTAVTAAKEETGPH